jgi:elongation factor P--(R)-beta-lysine ligase
MSDDAPRWWNPRIHEGRRPFLLGRNRLKGVLRRFFEERDFVEVEAACLQVSPGNETHLHAFATQLVGGDLAQATRYLHTSPEFACKKLLAAGERRIFDFARVFRNREQTPTHSPEFTMLEWYRSGQSYTSLMEDCEAVLALAADIGERDVFSFRGSTMDPRAPAERLTLAAAFQRFASIDLLATVDANGAGNRDALARAASSAGLRVADDDTWSDVFSAILVDRVEPRLGEGRATILCEYPISEAALARPSPADPRVAERFELYACGLELANAFGELTDAAEQRQRFLADMDEKERIYGERYPLDEEFLAALAIMPDASGIALGFDRLAMLATGAARIDQVIWTPLAPP